MSGATSRSSKGYHKDNFYLSGARLLANAVCSAPIVANGPKTQPMGSLGKDWGGGSSGHLDQESHQLEPRRHGRHSSQNWHRRRKSSECLWVLLAEVPDNPAHWRTSPSLLTGTSQEATCSWRVGRTSTSVPSPANRQMIWSRTSYTSTGKWHHTLGFFFT
jgi:hypothetical protein